MEALDVPTTPTNLSRSKSLRVDSTPESDNIRHHTSTSTPSLANLNTDGDLTLNVANNNTDHSPLGVVLHSLDNHTSSNDVTDNPSTCVHHSSSDESLVSSNNALNTLDVCQTDSSALNINGSVVPHQSTFSREELDAAQILSQSPLFRKKFITEESDKSSSLLMNKPSSAATALNSRVAALQKNGEEGWRRRVQKENKDVNCNVTTRQRERGAPRERPVSLMDRVTQLESSAEGWKVRVSESDAAKFTVAHKLAVSASASSVSAAGLSPGRGGRVPVLPAPKTRSSSATLLMDHERTETVSASSVGGSSCNNTPPMGASPPSCSHSTADEDSPSPDRKTIGQKIPLPKIFKSKTGTNIPQLPMPLIGMLAPGKVDYRRTISTPAPQAEDECEGSSTGQTVELFEVADEDFNAFFTRASSLMQHPDSSAMQVEVLDNLDLDHVTSNVQILQVQRRQVQRVARQRPTSCNPVRVLASKGVTEYRQVRLHAGERELKRTKVEELARNSVMAVEALAGLASREDFSSVTLKPVRSGHDPRELPPYTHPMLLRVKGRRHAHARLMKPVCQSVNAGDDFVLVTPTQVYHFKSEFANVIEHAKASEIAAFVVQQKDLGVSSFAPVIEITENVKGIRRTRFWAVLGGDSDSAPLPSDAGGDDEEVETCLARSNKVYRVQGSTLVPHPQAWGRPPSVQVLGSEQALVFDFGSELYSWVGKRAPAEERRAAVQLARELWDESYDYTDCDINPVAPDPGSVEMTGPRPSWGILGKITENLETVLFKEKFIDWPDTAQQSRIKDLQEELQRRPDPVCALQPCSGQQLLHNCPPQPDLLLEMTHLGRGTEYYDAEERRLLMIQTKEYRVWHTSEAGGSVVLSARERCHFHSCDTYVIRWYYSIMATGRTLKGAPSKHAVTGRERVAYFFWQGRDSSLSDKGASALLTVELDEERGPHVRVSMGAEPPAFLQLFQGALVVHSGRRGLPRFSEDVPRMYLVRGEAVSEGHLVEVEVDRAHLRSRECRLLLDPKTCTVHLWLGCKVLRHTRKVAESAAQHLSKASSTDVGWCSSTIPRVKDQYEGAETKDFWQAMYRGETVNAQTANEDSDYSKALQKTLAAADLPPHKHFRHLSLLDDASTTYDWMPRLWRLEAKHDCCEATERSSSYWLPGVPSPLPFVQEDLYASHIQPALFLLDAGGKVWLWQGWWPSEDTNTSNNNHNTNDSPNDRNGNDSTSAPPTNGSQQDESAAATTGSALLRFNFARKAALQTALDYVAALAGQGKGEPQLVVAGLEPLQFTNLFPVWRHRPDVAAAQSKGGRYTSVAQYSVAAVLQKLSRSHYSPEELRQHPVPDGVDPFRLEDYLTDDDFLELVGKTKLEFKELQPWKQLELKKKANLF